MAGANPAVMREIGLGGGKAIRPEVCHADGRWFLSLAFFEGRKRGRPGKLVSIPLDRLPALIESLVEIEAQALPIWNYEPASV